MGGENLHAAGLHHAQRLAQGIVAPDLHPVVTAHAGAAESPVVLAGGHCMHLLDAHRISVTDDRGCIALLVNKMGNHRQIGLAPVQHRVEAGEAFGGQSSRPTRCPSCMAPCR